MTTYAYDPSNALVTSARSIREYVRDTLRATDGIGESVDVEMGYPVTSTWTKTSPLENALVHFELDDAPPIKLGFGVPQTIEVQDDDFVLVSEPVLNHYNFDVGIWTSPQAGGTTKRMQIRQALNDLFGSATGRVAFTEATDGLQVVSYGGGSDVLDRINDLPVYRTMQITLVVSLFARLTQPEPFPVVLDVGQIEELSIEAEDGSSEHVTTIEDPWT